jgi:succinate dehydrogenase/fumarate reductase-like Fe-S protein
MSSEGKQVRLKVLRCNPEVDKGSFYQTYFVPVTEEKMNLLQALEYVYHEQDDTLAFRRCSCGLQFCNSCMMQINGKRAHACVTIIEPDTELEVAPLPGRRVLRDLIVEDHDE